LLVYNVVFGLGCEFGGVNLRWFELFVSKDEVIWIKGKMLWFEWIWTGSL